MNERMEQLGAALLGLAAPGMSPKDLMKAIRGQHPEASKKDVVRAAFYALTAQAPYDEAKIGALHAFALAGRADKSDDPTP